MESTKKYKINGYKIRIEATVTPSKGTYHVKP